MALQFNLQPYNSVSYVNKQSHGDNGLRAQYEQIVEQVRQIKESTLQVDERRFDAPVDRLEGTVKSASFRGWSWPGAG